MAGKQFIWLFLAVFLIGLTCAAAFSAELPLPPLLPQMQVATVSLDLKDVEVRTAIEALFRNSGKNFAIDANVDGTIPSVSFKDVSFDTALKTLTKSNGLVYRVDSSVYIISKRPETTPVVASTGSGASSQDTDASGTTTEPETQIEKIQLNYSSPTEMLAMLSGNGHDYGNYGGYGGFGNMMGSMMGGMMGGMGGFGNSMMGGMGGYGGMSSGYGGMAA